MIRTTAFYQERIAPHLPSIVLDFHVHVWRKADWHAVPWKSGSAGGAYMIADEDYSVGIPSAPIAQEIAFAVLAAGRAAGLPEESLRRVFFENGMQVLRSVRGGSAVKRIEAEWRE